MYPLSTNNTKLIEVAEKCIALYNIYFSLHTKLKQPKPEFEFRANCLKNQKKTRSSSLTQQLQWNDKKCFKVVLHCKKISKQ